jgi:seryl-tRNA synthetase
MKLLTSNINILQHLTKRYASALYMTGDKAKETFSILSPFMNFDRLKNVEALKNNIELRQLDLKLDDLLEQWQLYTDIEARKKHLDSKRSEIADKIKQMSKVLSTTTTVQQTDQLKNEGKILRDDLKNLKERAYSLEDVFIHNFLDLPNELHDSTPTDGEKKIIYTFGERPKACTSKSHMEATDLIEYTNPICYYLKGEAAKFDVLLPLFTADFFKKSGFIQFSNPDFVRSILVEASTTKPEKLFQLRDDDMVNKYNLLHLAGGGSMMSFLGYISKLSLYPTALPLQLVGNGKQYSAATSDGDLFGVSQASVSQLFIAAQGASEAEVSKNFLVENYIKFYELFEQHFQVVSCPAHHLMPAENHRIAVEMYSPSANRYIEIGNISSYSDFISKRLLFNYREGKEYKFPHVLSGTVVNVERLLAVLIEGQEMFRCPEFLKFD